LGEDNRAWQRNQVVGGVAANPEVASEDSDRRIGCPLNDGWASKNQQRLVPLLIRRYVHRSQADYTTKNCRRRHSSSTNRDGQQQRDHRPRPCGGPRQRIAHILIDHC
jgi:hypothetical protein